MSEINKDMKAFQGLSEKSEQFTSEAIMREIDDSFTTPKPKRQMEITSNKASSSRRIQKTPFDRPIVRQLEPIYEEGANQ